MSDAAAPIAHVPRLDVARALKRLPRGARIALGVLLAAYVLYLVAGNVLLGTGLLRRALNAEPDKLLVTYDSAWTPYPGRVIARNVVVRFQERKVQGRLALERASFQVSLIDLVRRTFHVTALRGEGARFSLRFKLTHLEGNEGRLAAYPRIEGFADPPMEERTPDLPIPEEAYDLWTLFVENVSTSIREIWVMEYRYVGDGSATGGFRLKPSRELSVDPSAILTERGLLTVAGADVLRSARGRLEARIDQHDPRVPKGPAVLRHMTARGSLEGDVASLAPLSGVYLPAREGSSVDRGAGHLTIEARLAHGVLVPETRVVYETRDLAVSTARGTFSGDLRCEAHVGPELALKAKSEQAAFAVAGSTSQAVTVRDLLAAADLAAADLTTEPSVTTFSAAIGTASAPDLRALQPLAPPHVGFEGGSATGSLVGSYRDGALDGRVDVALERSRLRVRNVTTTASGKLWSSVTSANVDRLVALGPTGADLRDVTFRVGSASAEGLWATLRMLDATYRPETGARATLSLAAGPGERTLRLITALASLPDAAAEAVAGSDLTATARIAIAPGDALAVTLDAAKNGKLDASGRLDKVKADTSGAFLVGVGPATAGVEIRGGDVSVKPFVRRTWLDERLGRRP